MDYGPNAAEPASDVQDNVYEELKKVFLEDLVNNTVLQETIGQHNNNRWHEERRKRTTAFNFGRICKLRKTTACSNTVKALLYCSFSGSAATRYGTDNEHHAIQQFEELLNVKVTRCGLFVDEVYPFLGASPDDLVGGNAITEIKCP